MPIDDKGRALGHALEAQQVFVLGIVPSGNFLVEIAEQRDLNTFLFSPSTEAKRTIDADSQNLGIEILVRVDSGGNLAQLLRTDASEGQRYEEQDDVFTGEIPEAYVLHIRILEGERGRCVSYLDRHLLTPHRLGKAAIDFVPVDNLGPSGDVVGPKVLVLEIIGVFPNIDTEDGNSAAVH